MTRVVGDLFRAWDLFAIGGAISLGVMIFGLLAARCKLLTGLTSACFGFIAILLFAALVYVVYLDGDRVDERTCDDFGAVEMDDCDSDDTTFEVLAYVLAVVVFLVAVALLCIISVGKRVRSILQVAIEPLSSFGSLLLVLVVIVLLGAAVLFWMFVTFVWGSSIADIDEVDEDLVPGGEVKTLDFEVYARVL